VKICMQPSNMARCEIGRMSVTGQYIPGDSVIHRLDPRVKIISTILLSVVVLRGPAGVWIVLSFLLMGVIAIAGFSFRILTNSLKPVRFFLLLLFVLHLFFTQGKIIGPLSWWGVSVTEEGLVKGMTVVWQFCLLIWGAAVLTATTSPSQLVIAIDRFLKPLKKIGVPCQDIATMAFIALRFFPVFLEELENIREAQAARGAEFNTGGPLKRVKTASGLLIPLLFSFVRRAENLAVAMEARAYASGPRSYMKDLRMAGTDYAALAIAILLTGLLFLSGRLL
jgi:energy-coupling factor transporter transmembrane protein EcfT